MEGNANKTTFSRQDDCRFATAAIHAGYDPKEWTTKPVIPPLVTSSVYKRSSEDLDAVEEYLYTRFGNPTRDVLEKTISAMEEGDHALCFTSGLSAVTAVVIGLLSHGDHIVSSSEIYGGTKQCLKRYALEKGIGITDVNSWESGTVEAAMRPNTKLVWIETPSNPTLKMVDIRAVADVVAKHRPAILVVDNTFMTPYFQKPLTHGADISMLSISKYMNGHGDLIMGALSTRRRDLYDRLRTIQYYVGMVPSVFDCYLVSRGLKTLHVRMKEHSSNALTVAQFLEKQPYVEKVIYPGLPNYPFKEVAQRQCGGSSGMVSFYIRGGRQEVEKFFSNLRVITHCGSLGFTESLICHPATLSHASMPEDQKRQLGITDNLIRFSVGLEDVKDILSDLDQAFQKAFSKSEKAPHTNAFTKKK